jgi:hypothetical protein
MSFFHKRSLLQSQKLLRREHAWRWTKIIFALVLLGTLLYGLSALSYYSKLNVQTVLVSGNSVVPTDGVLSVARDALRGRVSLIFSRANILWYPKQQIIDTLRYSYSWIDTISIDRINATTIAVKIKERAPVAAWCGISQDKPVPCHLVDVQSYLFAKAPEFSGAAYLKLYGPLTSASWRGAEFFSQQGLVHILAFVKALPEIGFRPVIVETTDASSYNVFTDGGAYISAQISDPVSVIISDIDSLLTQKAFAQSQINNFSNLLYIDARFGNKLFYKFK